MDSHLLPIEHLDVFDHWHLNVLNSSSECFPTYITHSNGIFRGDNPFDHSFNLLMFQISVISLVSCALYIILKPLGLPVFVNQMLAGVILGRSGLCKFKGFKDTVFPERAKVVIETMTLSGLMYHMFIIGVRLDINMVFTSANRAIALGMLGWLSPMVFGGLAALFVHYHSPSFTWQMFMIVLRTQSASYAGVTSSFLTDLKILNSEHGRLAVSSSVFSDICSVLMAGISKFPLRPVSRPEYVAEGILSVIFVWAIATAAFWAAATWVIKHTPEGKPVKEGYLVSIIVAQLALSFFAQATGQGYILPPFALGLAIPAGLPLGSALEEKLDCVSLVIMPIFFAICGFRSNFSSMDMSLWGISLILIVCVIAKLATVMSIGIYCKMPIRDAFIQALILNSKGVVELAVYNIYLSKKVLSREIFSLLTFSLLLESVIVSHLVKALYNPAKRYEPHRRTTIQHAKHNTEFGILTCVHNEENVPNIIQLLDVSNPNKDSPLNICAVHLVELAGRLSSLLIQHKRQKNSYSRITQSEQIVKALRNYEEIREGVVEIEIFTSISPSSSLHEDVCSLALDKGSSLIIIPFHKQRVAEGAVDSSTTIRSLNSNILERTPCSVGILISHTHLSSSHHLQPRKQMFSVCVLFFGGADDREALSYGMRMVGQHNVKLTVIRITSKHRAGEVERISVLDNQILNEFKHETIHNDRVWHKEEIVEDGEGVMNIIRSLENGYDLVMVGRRHMGSRLTTGLTEWMEHPELGVIGDILSTYDSVGVPYILVVQLGT